MKNVEVEIEGITPLLMNRFTAESEIQVSSRVSAVNNGDKGTPREQAEKTTYKDENGNLYIPSPNMFRAIIDAGKFHKMGKSKVTTVRSSLVPAGIAINSIIIPLGTKQFEVDSRAVVNPKTGGRVMKHRARLDIWRLKFTLEIDTDMFAVDFVRTLLDDAGKRVGLGDYRPDRKGPFGKFKVTKWKSVA